MGKLKEDVHQIIFEVCQKKGWIIDAIESDKNHLHLLLDITPKTSASNVAHRLKQITTFKLYRRYNDVLKKYFWKENTLWGDGYFVCSTGDASIETIKKYIEEQG